MRRERVPDWYSAKKEGVLPTAEANPHDGRGDKESYPHDCRADNAPYRHDRPADKNPYRHDGNM